MAYLMQLVAYGAQDIYLTENPLILFSYDDSKIKGKDLFKSKCQICYEDKNVFECGTCVFQVCEYCIKDYYYKNNYSTKCCYCKNNFLYDDKNKKYSKEYKLFMKQKYKKNRKELMEGFNELPFSDF